MYDLSIIIVNFNTKDLLLKCLESLKLDEDKLKEEIILVDNGSSDFSVQFIEKNYSNKVRLIKNKENLGFAKANNQGIKIAKGKYILLLNSDTVVKKGSLQKLVEFAESNKNIGVVGPKLLNADGSVQDSVFIFPTILGAVKRYWFGNKSAFGSLVPKFNEPKAVDIVVGAAFLITPVALKKVGLLDEKYFFFSEDMDYCRKVHNVGLKVYYLPTSEIVHYKGSSGKNIAGSKDQWRRQIPSSKLYHGLLKHYVITFILWSGQKFLGNR